MNVRCEGSNQRAGYNYDTEEAYCQDCLREFSLRELTPDCRVPVHTVEVAARRVSA